MSGLRYADTSILYWVRVGLAGDAFGQEVSPASLYTALELYYLNNGLYDAIQQESYSHGLWTPAMKGFRNPAHRVIEFYVSKLWPGQLEKALPIDTPNKAIIEPIKKIWEWSNWGANKQVAARWLSLFGDWLIKVATRNNSAGEVERVYLQNIKPQTLSDFDTDERGYLTFLRLDIPRTRRKENGKTEDYIHTEVWDKASQTYKLWEHKKSAQEELRNLGNPTSTRSFGEWGIDFIPFVHAKFQDIGGERGIGAFTHALDKIDEANRQATRFYQILFRYNKAVWALAANSKDASGRPLPAPSIGDGTTPESANTLELEDDVVIRLPGMSSLESMIPNINYDAALKGLQDHMLELERDLPELAYYRIRDMGSDLSGIAVRLMLSDAIDKVLEARGSAEEALARANSMALTIAQNAGLEGFSGLGTYEAGDFEHKFMERSVIPLTEKEEAEIVFTESGKKIPLLTALRRRGWTEEQIKEMEKDKKKEDEANQERLGQAMLNAQRNFAQPPEESQADEEDEEE